LLTETTPQDPDLQSCSKTASFPWYGVRTRSNCERLAATALENKGYNPFVPVYRVRRRWSDRVVETTVPLFPGYLFCRFDVKQRTPILSSPGVVSVVGFGSEPVAIPDIEIEAVETLLLSGLPLTAHAFLREGQRVRITRGALEGIEGTLVRKKADCKFVVSIPLLQRSVAVEIDPDWITA
jgi:transcription termination/antitermination protein NusG